MQKLTGLVLDDHRIFSESLTELLMKVAAFSQVDSAHTVETAANKLVQQPYDILFSDLIMPEPNISTFIKECVEKYPDMKIVVVSAVQKPFVIKSYLNTGISAFLSKSISSFELVQAIERVMKGERYVSTDVAALLATSFFVEDQARLTKKEVEIIKLVAAGNTIMEMADKLCISYHTVISHRKNIMRKLNLRSATEMVKFAYENNII